MFDVRLFKVPTFTGAQITAFVISSGMFAQFLFLPLYLESRVYRAMLESIASEFGAKMTAMENATIVAAINAAVTIHP